MAPLFDSHCHFAPGDDIAGVLARAREAGLSGLLAVGGDAAADAGARAAAALAPGFALPAFGIDRTEAVAYGAYVLLLLIIGLLVYKNIRKKA